MPETSTLAPCILAAEPVSSKRRHVIPPEVDALEAPILTVFRAAYTRLAELAAEATTENRRSRILGLAREADDILLSLDTPLRAWLVTEFPQVFALGAAAIGLPRNSFTLASADTVQRLVTDTYTLMSATIDETRRTTSAAFRRATVQAAARITLAGDPAAGEGRKVAAQLRRDADEIYRGVARVRYANGAYHRLDEWAETAVRTQTASTYNRAWTDRLRWDAEEDGQPIETVWVEVFDGANCGWRNHDDADKANGTVRRLDDVENNRLAHPRCRRSFGERHDVATPEEAARAEPTASAAARADQAATEREIAAQVARRAPRLAREALQARKARRAA